LKLTDRKDLRTTAAEEVSAEKDGREEEALFEEFCFLWEWVPRYVFLRGGRPWLPSTEKPECRDPQGYCRKDTSEEIVNGCRGILLDLNLSWLGGEEVGELDGLGTQLRGEDGLKSSIWAKGLSN